MTNTHGSIRPIYANTWKRFTSYVQINNDEFPKNIQQSISRIVKFIQIRRFNYF